MGRQTIIRKSRKINSFLKGKILLIPVLLLLLVQGCKISYSFSGASISPEVKTVSVKYFPNRARIINPALSQEFTDALMDKIKSQTNLVFVDDGDVNFDGEIVDYKTSFLAVTGDDKSAMTRFTISVKVRFTNNVDEDQDFDQVFSRYKDYDATKDLSEVEDTLVEAIITDIIEDVFNQAFVNW
jgi:hypothetical protein